jgi:hypothetical protein
MDYDERLEEVYRTFLAFEKEEHLFDWEVAGIPFWELIRYPLYLEILRAKGLFETRPGLVSRGRWNQLRLWFGRLGAVVEGWRAFLHRRRVLFFGHPRRKKGEDGCFWDLYCDPIIKARFARHLLLEPPQEGGGHLWPAATPCRVPLDGFLVLSRILAVFSPRLDAHSREKLYALGGRCEQRFGVACRVVALVEERVRHFHTDRRVWRWLLARLDPPIAFLVVSYGREAFLAACKDLAIPTLELQHGSPTAGKLNYDFDQERRPKRWVPDYVLTFGQFWAEKGVWPVPHERRKVLGYPYFESHRQAYSGVTKTDHFLVLSQQVIGKQLAQFCVRMADYLPDDVVIEFKLHPAEVPYWQGEYPELAAHPRIQVLTGEEGNLHFYQARAKWQAGVYSTALYEGMALGCATFLVDLPGVEFMRDVVDYGWARLLTEPQEVDLEFEPSGQPGQQLFAPRWEENLDALLSSLTTGPKRLG